MTDRATFLETVRGRLAGGLPTNHLREVSSAQVPTPPVRYTVDLDDPLGAFERAATAAGAQVVDLAVDATLDELLAELRTTDGLTTAVTSRDREVADLPRRLESAGIRLLDGGGPSAAAAADIGVSGAAFGIALTGSLVVDSSRSGTRLASLLPSVHLALLAPDRILATPGDLLRNLATLLPEGLPANLVCITGPSRSADIELQLTPGVHGPRRVIIGLLERTS